jgi:phosphoribosyl 1,2-cyclic phosphate phosphodiesterase
LPSQRSTLKSALTLTFLGTGTSQGVPMIGCDCDVCRSPDPRDNRLRSSIYIETPECSWVVDTGTDFRTQALREDIRRVDAVVFTHSHTDHIMGFDDLRRFSHARGSMPVYASAETMRDLERVFEFAFNPSNAVPYYLKPEPHVVDCPFKLGETLITPLPVPHGASIVNGYLFSRARARLRNTDLQSVRPTEFHSGESKTPDRMPGSRTGQEACVPDTYEKLVAYLSDCSAVPDTIVDLIAGVKVLIIDALRDRPHPTHLSVGQALEVAACVKPAATYFTHICHDLPQSAESRLPKGVRIAYDRLKLRF